MLDIWNGLPEKSAEPGTITTFKGHFDRLRVIWAEPRQAQITSRTADMSWVKRSGAV